jgi:hypothetical protein
MPKKTGMEKQMLVIKDKSDFNEMIADLGEDDLAILMVRKRVESDDQLRVSSYGEGQQTEFLGLLGYGTVIMHRGYFTDDDDDA